MFSPRLGLVLLYSLLLLQIWEGQGIDLDRTLGNDECSQTAKALVDEKCFPAELGNANPDITKILPNMCVPECRSKIFGSVQNTLSKCQKNQQVVQLLQLLPFSRDYLCLKSTDGDYCQLKLQKLLKQENVELNGLFHVALFLWANGTAVDMNEGGVNSTKMLPKSVLCNDCFKNYFEQNYAFVKSPNYTLGTLTPAQIEQQNQEIKETNNKCGANYINADAPLILGKTEEVGAGGTIPNSAEKRMTYSTAKFAMIISFFAFL
ncbi:hypothetical protein BKA69DRAFT_1128274 [Paraphysoderma sedebokerense]|nr:hypothetical protein BKA69DRAFT_1128274 [Paraphysoderma sedebokerense]